MNSRGLINSGLLDSPAANLRRAWQEGRDPALETFVAGLPQVSPEELAVLILVDFDARWSRNDPRRPEEYLRQFSAVAADAELAVDVIYAEYLAREQSGQRPELTEYQQRFPAFAQVLAEQIRLHQALETLDDDTQVERGESDASASGSTPSPGDPSEVEASFEIVEQIGSGGMGVVYKARQEALNRFVALKMVRAIDAGNPELLARFRSEARIVAALRHPNIVQIFDFGQHDGLPYLAMELIEGGSLADRLDGVPWDPRSAATLLCKLADAVQYAHERHVIHRDLKPANVLVVAGGQELEVKITDFGLAKVLAEDLSQQTRSVAFLGTPSYMAPEQASGRARDIGPAADIYALGAILYELLTGQPPFRGESTIETLRLLLSSEPVSIQRLAPRISRDVATICVKCLQADVNKRYASAAELRADLTRFLEGKPIHARPIGNAERAWRWCLRNPHLAGALGSVMLLLLGIATVSLWYSTRLSRELTKTRLAEQAEREANQAAQQRLWNVYLSEATARNNSRRVGQRFAALESIDKATGLLDTVGRTSQRERQLRSAVLSSLVLPDIRKVRSISELPAHGCDLSLTADCYVVAAEEGTLAGYRLSDSRRLWTIESRGPRVKPVLSRDGRFVAAVGPQGASVWRLEGSQPRLAWEADDVQFLTFAPDGEHALCSDRAKGMRLVRVGDGVAVQTIGKGAARSEFAYNARADRIAVCSAAGVQVIEANTGAVEVEIPLVTFEPLLAWHPSGEHLAVWGNLGEVLLLNGKTGAKVLAFPHNGKAADLSFNSDGSVLVTQSSWDQRLCAWDVGTGQRLLEVPEFFSYACDVTPDGRIVFLSVRGGAAELTELTAGARRPLAQMLYPPLGYWHQASVSPEGRLVLFSSVHGLELWDLRTTQRILARTIGPCLAEFDRTGNLILGCRAGIYRLPRRVETITDPGSDGAAEETRKTVVQYGPAEPLTGPMVPTSLAMSAGGETLAFQDEQGWALKHNSQDAEIVRLHTKKDPRKGDVSNDNRFVAVANWDQGGATVWDAHSGQQVADLAVGRCGVPHFSPDGRLLATTPDGVAVWRTSDWRCVHHLHAQGTTPTGLAIAFSPDSRVLAVSQLNGILSLVDPFTAHEWASLSRGDSGIASIMTFSPDQQWLITSSGDEGTAAQVWDLMAMRRELGDRGLDWPADVLRATVSPQSFKERLEVTLDDVRLIDSLPQPGIQESSKAAKTSR